MAINDVLIAARLLERRVDTIKLIEVRHDLYLKRTPVKVDTTRAGHQELTAVIPDAWLHFRATVPGLVTNRERREQKTEESKTITEIYAAVVKKPKDKE